AHRSDKVLGLVHWRKKEYDKAALHLQKAEMDATVLEALIRSRMETGELASAERGASIRLAQESEGLREIRAIVKALGRRRDAIRDAILKEASAPADQKTHLVQGVSAFVCAEWLFSEKVPPELVGQRLDKALAGVDIGPAYALRAVLALQKGQL